MNRFIVLVCWAHSLHWPDRSSRATLQKYALPRNTPEHHRKQHRLCVGGIEKDPSQPQGKTEANHSKLFLLLLGVCRLSVSIQQVLIDSCSYKRGHGREGSWFGMLE